jgi:RND family efflux transporter MFP subunit
MGGHREGMKRRIVWINVGLALLIIAAGAGAYFWLFAPKDAEATTGRTVSVQNGTVSESVTATGTVQTSGTVQLSFETSGTVNKVKASQGKKVKAGKVLATLDDSAARQALTNAESSLVQARSSQKQGAVSVTQARTSVTQSAKAVDDSRITASLNKKSYQQAVDSAKANLASATSKWSDSCLDPAAPCPDSDAWAQLRAAEGDVASAKTAYDQAVQTASANETTNNLKINQSQVNASAAQAKQVNDCATFGSSSQQCTSAGDGVRSAEQQLELIRNSNAAAATQSQQSLVNADARITTANITLKKLQNSLAKAAKDSRKAAQEALDTSQLNQKKGLVTDQQSIEKAQQSLQNAQLSVQAVEVGSGSTATAQAQLAVATAGLTAAEATLAQTRLTAPVAGTIASVDVDPGQAVQPGTAVMTLIPDAPYEIVASFSEADALKVKVGQPANVTFDALPKVTATGKVTSVDIVPTTGNNVTTYGVTITLDDPAEALKDGMSASVVVTTAQVTDVLWAPTAAITTAGGRSTVTVRKDGKDTTVQITTGLAGDSGTEITSGVSAGDQLVVDTSSSGGVSGFPGGGIPGGGFGGGFTGGGPPAGGGARTGRG